MSFTCSSNRVLMSTTICSNLSLCTKPYYEELVLHTCKYMYNVCYCIQLICFARPNFGSSHSPDFKSENYIPYYLQVGGHGCKKEIKLAKNVFIEVWPHKIHPLYSIDRKNDCIHVIK